MAKSKPAQANEKIAKGVVKGYQKIEDGVVGGYQKMEAGVVDGFTRMTDGFVERFLTKEGSRSRRPRPGSPRSRPPGRRIIPGRFLPPPKKRLGAANETDALCRSRNRRTCRDRRRNRGQRPEGVICGIAGTAAMGGAEGRKKFLRSGQNANKTLTILCYTGKNRCEV